ncbi:hypothetical protein JTB14_036200 [Gonioctena quinquepunctata]|nr:hypothetical protein JTB14_036200 [Gonioctena quinquepunctata]
MHAPRDVSVVVWDEGPIRFEKSRSHAYSERCEMDNQSFKLRKSKNKMSIPVEPEIITKNLPTHIQFLVRQRNAVSREFQKSKNRDKKIELLIVIKAIVIEMSSSQPDS